MRTYPSNTHSLTHSLSHSLTLSLSPSLLPGAPDAQGGPLRPSAPPSLPPSHTHSGLNFSLFGLLSQKNGSATRLADIKECQYNGGHGVDGWAEASPTTACGAGHNDFDIILTHFSSLVSANATITMPCRGVYAALHDVPR